MEYFSSQEISMTTFYDSSLTSNVSLMGLKAGFQSISIVNILHILCL